MIFQNSSTQTYPKNMANVRVQSHVQRPKAIELPGGLLLWKSMGKLALVVCLVTVTMNMFMGSLAAKTSETIKAVSTQRHELIDSNINLRAQKAHLLTSEQIGLAAGQKLALVMPGKGQRYSFK